MIVQFSISMLTSTSPLILYVEKIAMIRIKGLLVSKIMIMILLLLFSNALFTLVNTMF